MSGVILNVDDNEAGRYARSKTLHHAGFRVIEACNGREALSMVGAAHPDLVLLDVNLPDLNGIEVCRHIKADPVTATIPVLQISATFKEDETRIRSLDHGADSYLTDPVEPAVLVATIKSLLRMRQAEEKLRRWGQVFEHARWGVAIATGDGEIIEVVNPAFAEMHGYPADELNGRSLADVLPDLGDHLRASSAADHGHSVFESEHVRKDGSVFPVLIDVTAVKAVDASVAYNVINVQDITSRKRAESAQATLLAVSQVLAEATSFEHAAPRLLECITRLGGWRAARVSIVNADTNTLQTIAMRSESSPLPDSGAARQILETGKPVIVEDLRSHPNPTEWRAALAFPAVYQEQVLSVLEFFSADPRSPDADTLSMAAGLGRQLGQFIQRTRAEDAVRDSEERLRLAMNAGHLGLWDWDLLQNTVTWSETVGPLFGLSPGARSGSYDDFLARVHPTDRDMVRSAVERSVHEGAEYSVEFRVLWPDQSVHWQACRGKVYYNAAGKPVRMLGTNRDVTRDKAAETALRENERRLQRLIDSNIIGILFANKQRIIEANDVFLSMVGYTRSELETGHLDWRAITPAEYEELGTAAVADLQHTGYCTPFEKEYTHRDGTRVPVLVGAAVVKQTPLEWVCFVVDLTRQKQTERALRRSNNELEQFSAIVSHDLQEPLRIITASSELLRRRYASVVGSDGQELIRHAVEAVDRMRQLITDLLAYSHVSRSDLPVAQGADLNAAYQWAVSNLEAAIAASVARITSDPLPVVEGDAGRLAQLLQNLLSNAIKYRGPDPPQIHVSASKRNDRWICSVRDNGLGIDPRYKEQIFGVFKRLHGRDVPGTGIGLAICKRIVEDHGGDIWVESEPGRGSTFFFSLPVTGSEASAAT
jgi:PAS domain S-box-containing protein